MRRKVLPLVLLSALIIASFWPASAQDHQLELEVVDATGRPLSAVELVLLNGAVRRAFRTTEDGLAVFRGLTAGTYVA
ncbi:MAG: carboxypeptidase-like regulatory domain-containing protein, partial [Aigarchaeota archaeon]|nr:carboxypeptidase-like regulatory domain-containing protein [Aigarchaeota archaeon]